MGRRDFVFKWLFYALTALGFVLVQVFGLVHIRIWGVHPFLFPVLVSTVAALESAHESAVFALATGAVLDVTMSGVIPASTRWRFWLYSFWPGSCRPRSCRSRFSAACCVAY